MESLATAAEFLRLTKIHDVKNCCFGCRNENLLREIFLHLNVQASNKVAIFLTTTLGAYLLMTLKIRH